MRRLLVILCVFLGCWIGNVALCSAMPGSDVQPPLTHDECVRLIRLEMPNFQFSESSPMDEGFIASCAAGKGFYSRNLFNCMFSAKYIDSLDCQYKARGIDRSKQSPELAARDVIGDDGGYEAYVRGITTSVYQGRDPHTAIDPQLLKRYLDQRDNVIKSLGQTPPGDDNAPSHVAATRVDVAARTYWIVRENFTDLQLLKILREDAVSTETVFCARFGSSKVLRTDDGLCAYLIKKHWNVALPD